MDTILAARTSLSLLSAVFRLQGKPDAADTIHQVIAAYDAGKNVDAYMRDIANQVELGELDDWSGLQARIDAEVDAFLAPDQDQSESGPAPE